MTTPSDYPPPRSIRTRKAEVFHIDDYAELDKYACAIPESLLAKSYADVAAYLTKNARNDLDKVRAIFQWTASLDLPLVHSRTTELPEHGTPLDYLLRINWRLGNHANFIVHMARAAGLPCVLLNGINKSAAYQLGKPIDRRAMLAQWNAVYVDGEWRLLDVFWASTCLVGRHSADWALLDSDGELVDSNDVQDEEEGETVHTVNEFFFLPDPDHLIATHLPDDPQWQLLDTPVTFKEFEDGVYIRDRFFQLDMSIPDQQLKNGVQKTVGGHAVISLRMPAERSAKYDFRYLLFKSRHSTSDGQIPYERFVMYQKKTDVISYTARFPVIGRFKLDVFGLEVGQHDSYDLICSYLIDCTDADKKATLLPDCPEIGWGPGSLSEEAGLKAASHDEAVIETSDGVIDIRFTLDPRVNAVLKNVLHNELDAWLLSHHALLRQENGQLVVSMRLPQKGEYALKLFADSAAQQFQSELQNVCNYLIRCLNTNTGIQPFPKLHEGIIGRSAVADELGVRAVGHKDGLLTTSDGCVQIAFETDSDDVELVCELNCNGGDSASLADCVCQSVAGRRTLFDISLPGAGEYAVNVFARRKADPTRLHHVHTYLVTSTQQAVNQHVVTDGNRNEVGDVTELVVADENVVIQLPGREHVVAELRRKNTVLSTCGRESLQSEKDDDGRVLNVSLPEFTEYLLDVFEPRPGGGLEHIQTYAISRVAAADASNGSDADSHETHDAASAVEADKPAMDEKERKKLAQKKALEAKRRAAKQNITEAMTNQDVDKLKQAIADGSGVLSDSELAHAKKLLDFLKISQALADAMRSRKLPALEKAVAAAEKAGMEKRLGVQLAMARRILEQLRRIEKLRNAIMSLDQPTIAEIKSYSSPPVAVNHVMTATFLLLGESEKRMQEWREVQALIGKTGKESLKRRVSEFDVDKLQLSLASKVKDLLKNYNSNEIRDTSHGAATFYVWTLGMIEEAESRH